MVHHIVHFQTNPVDSSGVKEYVAWQLAQGGERVDVGASATITLNATALYTFDKSGFLHAWEPDEPHVFKKDVKLKLTGKQDHYPLRRIQI